jgi:hypothetical protein
MDLVVGLGDGVKKLKNFTQSPTMLHLAQLHGRLPDQGAQPGHIM